MRWAIVRSVDNRVVTFVRADLPRGFTAPPGCRFVRESDLPAGWQMVNDLPPVPASVGDLALRRALAKAGKSRKAIDAAIQGIADAATQDAMTDWWDRRIDIRRDEPELRTLAGLLGLTDAQVDGVFRVAGGAG